MDELEWLKENSPATRPSRDVTRRHRTQLRAAIAAEGADGTRPRRPRREPRSRHRVLLTGAAVVSVCAIGAGVIALASTGGGDGTSTVGAPAATAPATAPATAGESTAACASGPPKELAIPAGFGNPVAGAANDAKDAPTSGQQVTQWSSPSATIEQRWPADRDVAARFGALRTPGDPSIGGGTEASATVDADGVVHRTMVFTFDTPTPECSALQVTVYGRDVDTVDEYVAELRAAPFRSSEPLVTTTGTAAAAPDVVACEGVIRADLVARGVRAVATVGGPARSGTYEQPQAALAAFLAEQRHLVPTGYEELHLDDASIVYVNEVAERPVATVHVVPTKEGWTVSDWRASGC
jgi:hypothetical protein